MILNQKLKDFIDGKNLSIQDLRKLAKELGVRLKRYMKKRDIIKSIKKKLSESEKEGFNLQGSFPQKLPPSSQFKAEEVKKAEPSNLPMDLPESYNKDKLVAMPINPTWIHIYWDFNEKTKKTLENAAQKNKIVMRVYDVTYIIFDGTNAHRVFEIQLDISTTKNYYFNVPMPDADYLVELGYVDEKGNFYPILRSNVVRTPSNSPKYSEKEEWKNLKTGKIEQQERSFVHRPVERIVGSSDFHRLPSSIFRR